MTTLKLIYRRPALVVLLFLTGLLFLVLPFFRPAEVPVVFLFAGRLHPLVLHFPIVLIILAFLFEVAGRYYRLKTGENTVLVILAAAAISAVVSVAAGFFLFASGDYSGPLMERHFWAGAITGAGIFFSLAFFYIHRSTQRYYYWYFFTLLLSTVSVGYASHLGGSITHGRDYLTEHLQFIMHALGDDKEKSESEMLVYEDMISPVFESKCMSCHNDQRAKGDLAMTSYESLLKGGKSGLPSLTLGNPLNSELYKRVILPEGHDDRMPPEGKTPMNDSEIALLKFWIASGAGETLRLTQVRDVDSMRRVVVGLLPELAKYRRREKIEQLKLSALEQELQVLAQRLDITIHRDSLADGNFFAIAMKFPPAPFTNDQFRELRPYFDAFTKVSLISSGIDDAGLYYIGQMRNLRELYLQKTKVDGSGIVHLQNLAHLEILNLSFTSLDDKGALDLLKMHSLREVYLYRTKTSMQVIEALRRYKPAVKFLLEEGPYL